MKRTVRWIASLLAALLLLLSGCQEQPEDPAITESLHWETMPALTYGQMEYEKLKVEPWYCGRAEATGFNLWAETQAGFYHAYNGTLMYADKAEKLLWVPVCKKPTCNHAQNNRTCQAYLCWSTFFIHNNRIYFAGHNDFFPEVSGVKDPSEGLYSRALDGSDMRPEKLIEETIVPNVVQMNCTIMGSYWIYNTETLNTDGSTTGICYCYDILGGTLAVPFNKTYPDGADYNADQWPQWDHKLYGDPTDRNMFFGTDYYRVENGEMVATNAEAYAKAGDYLSGSVLRQFRSNEGYYDINLETGEEVHLADAQLKNSQSFIVLPNCIIETTLGSENHQEGDAHAMTLFDGESWRTVTLPEELTESYTLDMPFEMGVVTSDRIIILVYTSQRYSRCDMYQIMLGEKDLFMEYCTHLK